MKKIIKHKDSWLVDGHDNNVKFITQDNNKTNIVMIRRATHCGEENTVAIWKIKPKTK